MEDLSGFDWQGKPRPCSLELQLDVLGLDREFLENLKKNKSRVLDIGCGETFELVKYLRNREINAEGLDPRIKEGNEYLMDMGLPKGFKEQRKIMPRPDDHYDLIISHCMDYFYDTIYVPDSEDERESIEFDNSMPGQGMILCANFAILEAVRVLKPASRIIIYPSICALPNLQKALEERKCDYKQQALGEKQAKYIREKCWGVYSWFEEPIKRGDYKRRTVIHKS